MHTCPGCRVGGLFRDEARGLPSQQRPEPGLQRQSVRGCLGWVIPKGYAFLLWVTKCSEKDDGDGHIYL